MCSFKTIQTKLCRAEVKMSLLDLNNLHAEKHLSLFSFFLLGCIKYPGCISIQASGEEGPKLESHQLDKCLQ